MLQLIILIKLFITVEHLYLYFVHRIKPREAGDITS
jgi:hypothetical protein